MQRRVEQADRDREPRHGLEDAFEVGLLVRKKLLERGATLLLAAGHDHLAHDGQPVVGHEHVLGVTETDALRAELAGLGGVLRVSALARTFRRRIESAQPRIVSKSSLICGGDEIDRAQDHAPRAAVEREHVALGDLLAVEGRRPPLRIHRERLAARNARRAHASRHDRGVRSSRRAR